MQGEVSDFVPTYIYIYIHTCGTNHQVRFSRKGQGIAVQVSVQSRGFLGFGVDSIRAARSRQVSSGLSKLLSCWAWGREEFSA